MEQRRRRRSGGGGRPPQRRRGAAAAAPDDASNPDDLSSAQALLSSLHSAAAAASSDVAVSRVAAAMGGALGGGGASGALGGAGAPRVSQLAAAGEPPLPLKFVELEQVYATMETITRILQTRRAVPNFATIKKGVQGVTKRSLSYREVEQLAQVAPQLVQLTPGVDRAKTLVEVAAAEGVRTDEAGAAAAAQRKQRLHDALLRVARGHYAEFLTGGGFGRPEEAAAAAAWEHGFDPDRHVPDIAIKRRQWNAAAPGGGGGYNPGSAGGSSSSGSDGPTPSAARRPSPLRTPAMERPRTNTSDDGSVPSDAELLERVRRRAQEQARQQLDVVKNSENMLVADLPKLAETIHLHYRRKKRTRIYTDDLVAALLSGQQQHKKTLNEATVVQQLQLLRRVCANWISPVELQGRELLQVNKSVEFKEVQQHLRLVVQEARRREIARRAEAAQAAAEAAAQ